MKIRYDENDQPLLYSDILLVDTLKSEDTVASLRIRREADVSFFEDARARAG